jgi:hypothetical protein
MKVERFTCPLLTLAATVILTIGTGAAPLETAFNYQGRLTDGTSQANGIYHFNFELFDAPLGGSLLNDREREDVVVSNGLFNVVLDFGPNAFAGQARWLQVNVQTNNGGGFTMLTPRQQLLPVPNALFSTAAGGVTNGAITSAMLDSAAVTTAKLADGSVTSAKLAPGTTVTNVLATTNNLALGTASVDGRLDIYRTSVGTPAIQLLGANNTLRVFSDDGLEKSRLDASPGWGQLQLNNNSLAGQRAVIVTANGTGGGSVLLSNSNGQDRAVLSGGNAGGYLSLFQLDGDRSVVLTNNQISTFGSDGLEQIRLWGPAFGELLLYNGLPANAVSARLTTEVGLTGALFLNDASGNGRAILRASSVPDSNSGGSLVLNQPNGTNGLWAYANGPAGLNPGGHLRIFQGNGADSIGFVGNAQQMSIINKTGQESVRLSGPSHGELLLRDGTPSNNTGVRLYGQSGFSSVEVRTGGILRASLVADAFSGGLICNNAAGTGTIFLDGSLGKTITKVLQITGGSDLSEQFDVQTKDRPLEPGMVVCIDRDHPGQLVVSTAPYDRTVAGIVSGAGGIAPGMLMGQQGTMADGKHPVALTGRVYCLVDASKGAVFPGDLLTSSETDGHAMKVTDHDKAQGAIIGKAMTGLGSGRGLVLVLVSLQ